MDMTDEHIRQLAELARLDLTREERDELRADLEEILDLAESIQEVDTGDVPPTYHAVPVENVLDEDTARPSLDPDEVLENAPDSSDDYFVVPRIIEDA